MSKIKAGASFPSFSWPKTTGETVTPADHGGWRFLTIYRGKHCPLCKQYLTELNGMQEDFKAADISVWALSADPLERARSQAEEEGWTIPILAELTEDQMRAMRLYISSPRSADETDRNFAEPATFVINPQGEIQIVDISNAPFSRPDLTGILKGIRFVAAKDYPIRGIVE
ncbi:peroxiredoxin family protein [Croceicoccus sp. YJ47]|uniref:peroxiredoxin family protein n=1 Tax=Croceicoccus sp. YJ47 TaxID=2798724 RepID=UPI001923ABA2|nr:peroxiredoxin family protein [Croceicoccus sp. YJ47]QQN74908.1 peroxiredoxin family protein [Croceicoccus sp. YJ47]